MLSLLMQQCQTPQHALQCSQQRTSARSTLDPICSPLPAPKRRRQCPGPVQAQQQTAEAFSFPDTRQDAVSITGSSNSTLQATAARLNGISWQARSAGQPKRSLLA